MVGNGIAHPTRSASPVYRGHRDKVRQGTGREGSHDVDSLKPVYIFVPKPQTHWLRVPVNTA